MSLERALRTAMAPIAFEFQQTIASCVRDDPFFPNTVQKHLPRAGLILGAGIDLLTAAMPFAAYSQYEGDAALAAGLATIASGAVRYALNTVLRNLGDRYGQP